jgi:hypothetical protein
VLMLWEAGSNIL